jgi:hypothetical protein
MMMKKWIVFMALLGIVCACNKSDSSPKSNLVGSWKLSEILADPGDGSGIFNAITSNKTLIFDDKGNVGSNNVICNLYNDVSTKASTGTYSEKNATITSADCANTMINYVLKNDTLILIYPCIEACKAKYIRLR